MADRVPVKRKAVLAALKTSLSESEPRDRGRSRPGREQDEYRRARGVVLGIQWCWTSQLGCSTGVQAHLGVSIAWYRRCPGLLGVSNRTGTTGVHACWVSQLHRYRRCPDVLSVSTRLVPSVSSHVGRVGRFGATGVQGCWTCQQRRCRAAVEFQVPKSRLFASHRATVFGTMTREASPAGASAGASAGVGAGWASAEAARAARCSRARLLKRRRM